MNHKEDQAKEYRRKQAPFRKRTLQRGQPRTHRDDVMECYGRLFTGKGSESDAVEVLADLDFIMTSMKTSKQDKGILEVSQEACLWQAGICWFINYIRNNIQSGLNPSSNSEHIDDTNNIRGL